MLIEDRAQLEGSSLRRIRRPEGLWRDKEGELVRDALRQQRRDLCANFVSTNVRISIYDVNKELNGTIEQVEKNKRQIDLKAKYATLIFHSLVASMR